MYFFESNNFKSQILTCFLSRTVCTRYVIQPVAPVAYQVILEPGIGQFREFEPRRVHTLVLTRRDFFLRTN